MEDMNNKTREIPYGKNILVNCPICGFKGEPTKYRKGNIFLEIVLRFLLLIPGVIYTTLRHINTFCLCPKCKQHYLLEVDGDESLINCLCKIKRKQLIRFWVIVSIFLLLGFAEIFGNKDVNNSVGNNYFITNNHVKYSQQFDNNVGNSNSVLLDSDAISENSIVEEKNLEISLEDVEPKDPKDEIREKMKNILNEIDRDYGNISSYVGARCYGDCVNGIIKIKFRENIGWYDFTVKAHQAVWANKIIRDIPGAFEKIQIDFIYGNQTVSSCIFTEYQMNTYTPKGCTYYGYKE